MSELFREALRRYEQMEQWRPSPVAIQQFGGIIRSIQQDARRAGLDRMTMRDIDAEVAASRKSLARTPRSNRRPRK